MAKSVRLNVYVTPAGFYDAVVAAPNQKAALAAWGVHANLFADGVAGPEEDPAWREKALASPGEVIRKPRGDPAAILAQPSPKPAAAKLSNRPGPRAKASHRVAPPPPPPADRAPLTAAERALADARQIVERSRAELAQRRRALEYEAAELQDQWEAQEAELASAVEQARRAFAAAGGAL